MLLAANEPVGNLLALNACSLRTLACRLASVVLGAQRLQVGVGVIVTGFNVIHVGRTFSTDHATFDAPLAFVVIAAKNPFAYALPIGGQTAATCRGSPAQLDTSLWPPTGGPRDSLDHVLVLVLALVLSSTKRELKAKN